MTATNAMPATSGTPEGADESYLPQAPAPQRGFSIASLVLGITSILFGYTFFVPLAAVICGIIGLRKERESKPMAIAGIVAGVISFLAWVVAYIVFVFAVIAFTMLYFVMIFAVLAQQSL